MDNRQPYIVGFTGHFTGNMSEKKPPLNRKGFLAFVVTIMMPIKSYKYLRINSASSSAT
jgi:hypothetical protein